MTKIYWIIAPSLLGLACAAGARGAADEPKNPPPPAQTQPQPQPQKGVGETITTTVDEVVESVKRGARATSEGISEQYHKMRASVHDMGVQARLYTRLHWDKDLNPARIDVEVKEGTAALHGAVRTLEAKAKAIALARDTVGVDRVEDHLTLEPAAPPNEAVKVKP